MAENDSIRSISISVTTDTKTARLNIDTLVRSLQRLVDMVAALKTVGGSIDSMAKGLDALGRIDLHDLPEQMEKIAEAMKSLTNLDFKQTRSLNAQANLLSAQNRQRELAIREKTAATEAEAEARKREMLRLGIFRTGSTRSGDTNEPYDPNKISDDMLKANAAVIAFRANAMSLASVVGVIQKIASAVATTVTYLYKFSTIVGKVAFNFAKLTAKIAIAPWKRLGSAIGDTVKRLSGFFAAIKRIAIYRAIRSALKMLTQAFKEGMENLYQYSLLIDGQFYKSMDMLATSALYAKNSLAAMASPIVNVLAPAVDMITDKFVDMLNTVNELIASLTGADTWTKALKYPKAYAEAADGANGKAKELRATLLGFDEINRLDDNRRGSRGSAAEELDYSKMFEEQTVATKAKDFVSAIKKAFASGDFTDIGKSIGQKIKSGLDKIDWAGIERVVTRNASSVATLINGLVDVEGLGETIGGSIASAFNVAVSKMQTFFGTVRWDKVGTFLGDGINGVLKKFDVAKLGQNLATIVNSAVTLIHNFTSTVKWSEVGSFVAKGINNFLATIKGRDIGETIAGIIGKAVDLIHGFTSTVKWSEFGKFLSDGINGFFNSINTSKLAETISSVIKNAAKLVHTFFTNTDFQKIGDKIGELITGLDWKGILSGLGQVLFDALKAAIGLAKGILEKSPLFATALAGMVAYKIAVALGATTVTETIAGAMGKSVAAGAASSGAGIAAGSSAAGIAAGVALAGLATIAVGWIADKITDGESTSMLEQAFGISLRKASHSGNEDYNKDTTASVIDRAIKNAASQATSKNKVSLNITTDVHTYASGGSPETGTLFLAGEAGAEIISSASGKTTVSNRDQIADSVAAGNEEGNEILRELLSVARTISAKEFTSVAQITTGQITSALNRANVRSGSTVVPVQGG